MGNTLQLNHFELDDINFQWGLIDEEEIQKLKEIYFRKYLHEFLCDGISYSHWVLREWNEDSFWRFQKCLSCLLKRDVTNWKFVKLYKEVKKLHPGITMKQHQFEKNKSWITKDYNF